MEKLVSTIFEQNPNTTVVLASIPPISKKDRGKERGRQCHNAVLPGIVAKEKALNHKIEFADIHSVFTDPADLWETKFIPARLGITRWLPLVFHFDWRFCP